MKKREPEDEQLCIAVHTIICSIISPRHIKINQLDSTALHNIIHNANDRVEDQLIEKIKTMDTLAEMLQLAKTVESTVQMETLSKQLLQNIGRLNTSSEVHAVQKCHHNKNKCFQLNSRSTSSRKSSSWDKGEKVW